MLHGLCVLPSLCLKSSIKLQPKIIFPLIYLFCNAVNTHWRIWKIKTIKKSRTFLRFFIKYWGVNRLPLMRELSSIARLRERKDKISIKLPFFSPSVFCFAKSTSLVRGRQGSLNHNIRNRTLFKCVRDFLIIHHIVLKAENNNGIIYRGLIYV